jgi:hypothetical protein
MPIERNENSCDLIFPEFEIHNMNKAIENVDIMENVGPLTKFHNFDEDPTAIFPKQKERDSI